MKRGFEMRNGRRTTCYMVDVSEKMREKSLTFAKEIVLTDNQYSRLLPAEVWRSGDVSLRQKIEIQRTYMGKLGEVAFLVFLWAMGKKVPAEGMFEIYEGQTETDSFDFQTADGSTVDVKTGFRAIHKRLLVNSEQFTGIPKDYYAAVKLNAVDTDSRQKLVDWDSVTTAKIVGYVPYGVLKQAPVRDFGEGLAHWMFYDSLPGIDSLVEKF